MKTVAGAILVHAAVVTFCCGATLGKGDTGESLLMAGMAGAVVSLGILIWGLITETKRGAS